MQLLLITIYMLPNRIYNADGLYTTVSNCVMEWQPTIASLRFDVCSSLKNHTDAVDTTVHRSGTMAERWSSGRDGGTTPEPVFVGAVVHLRGCRDSRSETTAAAELASASSVLLSAFCDSVADG